MFEITEFTEVTLASVTNRVEKHGDEEKPAVTLSVEFTEANTILDLIDPGLRHCFWKAKPDAEPELPGVEQSTPVLRSNSIEKVTLTTLLEGWRLYVDDNIDAEDPMAFGGVKVDKITLDPQQGGSCSFKLRLGTSDVDADRLGVLAVHNGQSIWLKLLKPEKAPERTGTEATGAEIDGTKGHPGAAAGQGDLLADTPEGALAGALGGDASITEGGVAGAGPDDEQERDGDDEGSSPDTSAAEASKAALDASGNNPFPQPGQAMTDAQAKAAGTDAAEDGQAADAKPGRLGRKTAAVA